MNGAEIDRTIDQVFYWNYTRWLFTLKDIKREHPEAYDIMADYVREYREWVVGACGREDFPEVPTA